MRLPVPSERARPPGLVGVAIFRVSYYADRWNGC
jgi:hypothetical protein